MKSGDLQPTNFASTESGIGAALSYLGTSGGTVQLPVGTISVSSPLNLPNAANLRGHGRLATVLQASASFSGAAIVQNSNQVGGQQWCSVSDMQIDGTGATVTRGLYFKSIGQPSHITNVFVNACSGDGIVIESSSMRISNSEGNACGGYNVRFIDGGDIRCDNLSVENIASGKAGLYFDGVAGPASYQSSAFYLTGVHVEVIPDNASQGILISNSKNISINGIKYFGGGGVGDLVKITGAATDSYGIILENVTASIASVANLIVDSTRSHTIANQGDTGTVTLYSVGGQSASYETFAVHDAAVFYGAATLKSTLAAQGAVTVGLSGTNAALTVGTSGSGNDTATITVDSGSGASGVPKISLSRNNSVQFQAKYSPGSSANMFLMNAPLFIATTGEVVGARWENSGKLRLGSNASPTYGLEVGASGVLIDSDEAKPFGMKKQTVAVSAPGAGYATLRWEVGTGAGTAKLVAYAGTSTTGVTIVDNVGGGF